MNKIALLLLKLATSGRALEGLANMRRMLREEGAKSLPRIKETADTLRRAGDLPEGEFIGKLPFAGEENTLSLHTPGVKAPGDRRINPGDSSLLVEKTPISLEEGGMFASTPKHERSLDVVSRMMGREDVLPMDIGISSGKLTGDINDLHIFAPYVEDAGAFERMFLGKGGGVQSVVDQIGELSDLAGHFGIFEPGLDEATRMARAKAMIAHLNSESNFKQLAPNVLWRMGELQNFDPRDVAGMTARAKELIEARFPIGAGDLDVTDIKPDNFVIWNGRPVLADFSSTLDPNSVAGKIVDSAIRKGTLLDQGLFVRDTAYESGSDFLNRLLQYNKGPLMTRAAGAAARSPFAALQAMIALRQGSPDLVERLMRIIPGISDTEVATAGKLVPAMLTNTRMMDNLRYMMARGDLGPQDLESVIEMLPRLSGILPENMKVPISITTTPKTKAVEKWLQRKVNDATAQLVATLRGLDSAGVESVNLNTQQSLAKIRELLQQQ